MRPIRRYQFRFEHPLALPITLESDGETPCMARGFAWQALEQLVRDTPDLPHDNYWKMAEQVLLGLVQN